jgi:hypothetical protein
MSPSLNPQNSVLFTPEDDRDMLDSLRGLSIKGFHDCNEANTPSSTNASLPTPPALQSSLVLLASPVHTFGEGWPSPQAPIQQPGTPLMKDLDSFTEGTGQGSFDFLPLTADEGLPLIFHPPDAIDDMAQAIDTNTDMLATDNPLALDLLPSPSNLEDAVLAWRENVVSPNLPPPLPTLELPVKKRRRSLTLDGDDEERRTRAWSPSPESLPIAYMEPQVIRYPTNRTEPEAPD